MPITGGTGQQAYYGDKVTKYNWDKYVQVLNPSNNSDMTSIIAAARKPDYYVQYAEGIYSDNNPYAEISGNIESEKTTQQYNNETWLHNQQFNMWSSSVLAWTFFDEW